MVIPIFVPNRLMVSVDVKQNKQQQQHDDNVAGNNQVTEAEYETYWVNVSTIFIHTF